MADTLPEFPVDDVTLNLLDHALDARLTFDEDGDLTHVGADMTVPQLLDFLSGYDPSLSEPNPENPDISVYPRSIYHRDDVIRALIAEVRRLREGVLAFLEAYDHAEPGDFYRSVHALRGLVRTASSGQSGTV